MKNKNTKRSRRAAFAEACLTQYRANENLGYRKRTFRRLKAENPKGYKALNLDKETDSKGC